MTSFAILGAGGHARVVVATVRASGGKVIGCIGPDTPDRLWPDDIPWLGGDEALARLDEGVALLNGLGSTDSTALRRTVFEAARAAGRAFAVLRHPSATIEAGVMFGAGAQVLAGAILQTGVRIGDNVIVNTGAILDHDTTVADHAHIAPGARLSGGVTVRQGAHIGIGAVVIQGVTIGENAMVGAGAVVLRDVPANARVAGVPARPLKGR